MKLAPLIAFLIAFTAACKEDNVVLNAEFVGSIEPCFSEIKLRGHEIIIQTEEDYVQFEDSVRRRFSDSCKTEFLPEINFKTHFFIGKHVTSSGCSVDVRREVVYDPNNEQYHYNIQYKNNGACNIYFSDMNWAIVPVYNENAPIVFNVSVQ